MILKKELDFLNRPVLTKRYQFKDRVDTDYVWLQPAILKIPHSHQACGIFFAVG